MTVMNEGALFRKSMFGIRVANDAGKTLPATGTGTIFTVTGGNVLVTSIVGVVTTAIQAQANAVKLVATPTVGTVNNLTDTTDVNGWAVGGLLAPTSPSAGVAVLTKTTGGGILTLALPFVIAAGAIGLNTAATSTGAIKWTLTYVPLDDGATVTAA